ncbi:MAG: carboxypeptidase regulatory-like domain-containing protein [Acidobacteria bacterium]|nr:carboxypeptidase regulatory-like domain-containing protein [Acidobacteriota bacterium]
MSHTFRVMTFALFILALVNVSFAQTRSSEIKTRQTGTIDTKRVVPQSVANAQGPWFYQTPVIACKQLWDWGVFNGQTQYEHFSGPWEMRVNQPVPASSFPVENNGSIVELDGGMPAKPELSAALNTSVSGNVLTSWSLGPMNQIDRAVSAIVIRGGNGLNVYTYPNLAIGDNEPLIAPGGATIENVVLCMEPFSVPSSAEATISGRALTMTGTGISSARIQLTNLATGQTRIINTNPFGYYTFQDINVAELYQISISHKRHQFIEGTRTFTLDSDLTGLDFVSSSW